ncbi:DUF2231 domain-containing protein [Actinomadura viridis]|uniref:DUF2231 domain-containing protein n=1 Tax=Actinomadura viridis TaxID=58110 RepID=A0A931DQB2_9ACTN|nr:hypothetical protein [Actinomadura viridis]MBG6093877.1 hypothetical protein [Actinomadura viridis]
MNLEERRAQERPEEAGRSPFVPAMRGIERARGLDTIGKGLEPVIRPLSSSTRTAALLRGRWFGHAAHPALTDLPLGAWTCTSLLDLFGGRRARPAARGLLAFGLAAAVPTVLSGAVEWDETEGGDRRVGVAHAGINGLAACLYGASLMARRRHRHGLGVGLALAGGAAAIVGGYLGGHLTLVRHVGSSDPGFEEEPERQARKRPEMAGTGARA